ncbi:MAG: hydrogenase iron-sulfur subunit [Dehalococcoidia bacterium]|nr:MAG: hydrogenase iron-sulfur subunit [Dehalococcoidia bacterium]
MNKRAANIVTFACNWDGLSCVESAAQAGLSYPASVRVVRVTCLSRLHMGLILKAFELGADGVMLLGCEPGNCQFDADSGHITHEYEKARMILKMLGLQEERLALCHIPRGDGPGFVKRVSAFINEIEQLQARALTRV